MESPLNIALANSGRKWIGEIGHVVMLYEELEKQGHIPHIVCRRDHPLHHFARDRQWRHLALTFHSQFRPWSDFADVRKWLNWSREHQIDVLHCHRGKDHWAALPVAQTAGLPLVRTRHVVTPIHTHPFNRWLYLRATDAILCVSDATRASFGPWQDRLPGGGKVVLAAVDTDRFHPEKRSQAWHERLMQDFAPVESDTEPVLFGLIGRLQNVKGQKFFIRAAAQVSESLPEARFIIAGAGPDAKRRALLDQAREAGLADKLHILGRLDDLPSLLATLDVGVIASIGSEGSSRIALEMMASGLPLVATTVGGIAQLTRPAGGVRLIAPREPEAMAEAMVHWARHPAERQEAGRSNRRHTEQHHQPATWAGAMVQTYSDLLEHRRFGG